MDYLAQIEDILTFGNRSQNTITSYKTYTSRFFTYCVETLHKDPGLADDADIRAFLTELQQKNSLSDATINHAISEIRFFFESVLRKDWNEKAVPHRRFERLLPYVPDRGTVEVFISSITDLKLKAMFALMYSAGLRVSEVCTLKCSDIEHANGRIHVPPSKSHKDRYVILAEPAYDILVAYWKALPKHLKTRDWLFTRQRNIEKPIYPQFPQSFIAKHEASLGLPHRITCHSFRHAYATHSFAAGMDFETLSLLMGHSSTQSTRIYVHLAQLGLKIQQFQSPIEGMVNLL